MTPSEGFHECFWGCIGIQKFSRETLDDWEQLNTRNTIIEHVINIFNLTEINVTNPLQEGYDLDQVLNYYTASKLNLLSRNLNETEAALIERFHFYTILSYDGHYVNALIDEVFQAVNTLSLNSHEFTNTYQLFEYTHALSHRFLDLYKGLVDEIQLQRQVNIKQTEEIR